MPCLEPLGAAMKRREFIALLGGAAVGWPLMGHAQQSAMPVIGFLAAGSPSSPVDASRVRAFRQGLGETGYVEGKNVSIEYRWAEGQIDRLPALAADLVRRQVSVISTTSTSPALAAKAATTTTPIVFEIGGNPVEVGLVASLNRPGANITGVTTLNTELGAKRLQLLHELVPKATDIAHLVNPRTNAETKASDLRQTAQSLGLQLHVLHASTERDFDSAFLTLVQLRAGALMIEPDALFTNWIEQLAALTSRHAVPAAYEFREFTAAGGLMSYGSSLTEAIHQVGVYSGRILKGEKPADLPVQQATKVELFINLKSARALGVTVPNTLAGRADELIE